MADIQGLTGVATSSPEQAVQNINNAAVFSLNPTDDKAFNSTLAPQAAQALKPTDASPAVHDYMSQGTEHTALATPDVPHLNFIDETIKRAGDFIHGRKNVDEQISDLALKRMGDPSAFSDEDEGELFRLNQERQTTRDYKPTEPPKSMEPFSNIAEWVNGPEVADHIADFLGGFADAAKEGASTYGSMRVRGPVAATVAFAYGFARSGYKHIAGQAYNDLSNQTNPDGTPSNIDEVTKKHIAMGVGIVGAGLQVLPMAMGIPGVGAASVAENAVLRSAVTNIGKQVLVFGSASAATEATRIIGEETGKSWDGTHASLVDGVVNASKKIDQYAPRVGGAFEQGAILGGVFGVAGELLSPSRVGGGKASPETGVPDAGPTPPPEGPVPTPNEIAQARVAKIEYQLKNHENAVASVPGAGPKDLLGAQQEVNLRKELESLKTAKTVDQSVKVMQFKAAMEEVQKTIEKTGMGKLSPGQMSDVLRRAFERSGMQKVFTTVGRIRDLLPGTSVEKLIAPVKETLANQEHTPFQVDLHTVADIAKDNPKMWDGVMLEPDGPTAVQAEKALKKLQAVKTAEKTRTDILDKLGLKFEDVKPEKTNVVKGEFGKEKPVVPFDVEGHTRRAGEILAEMSPKLNPRTLHHGTNSKFDEFDYDKGGGMVHFAEKPEDSWKYANDTGSSGRKRLGNDEVELHNTEGESPVLKWDAKLEGWISPDRKTFVTKDEIRDQMDEDGYTPWSAQPINSRVIEHQADMNKVVDTISKEGLEKLKSVLKPTNRRIKEFIEAIDSDLENGGRRNFYGGEFGHSFWSLTKHSRGDEINASLKEMVKQLQEAGYHGIRFIDDSHATVAMFDPKGNKETDNSKLQAELEDIKSKVANHYKQNPPGQLLIGDWDEPDSENALDEHVKKMTFTDAIRSVTPAAQVTQIEEAQKRARQATVDNLKETALHEMGKVQDIQEEMAKDARIEQERARISNDPNYAIVDKILNAKKIARREKLPHSIYQIDPKTLPTELLKYTDHFRLKEFGIFKKGGADAGDVANLLGVDNAATLLHILSKTPSRDQVISARAEANAAADAQEARGSVDLNHTRIVEAIHNEAATNLEEMRFMLDHEWPATKQGIKKIALPAPRIEALDIQAEDIINKTKWSELDPRRYEVGARRNLRAAINAILKNEVYAAFQFKEAETLNILLRKHALIAIGKGNRDLKFARKFRKTEIKALVKGASPLVKNAINEILTVWNFRPAPPLPGPLPVGNTDAVNGDFNKWVIKTVNEGKGDFSVPDYLTEIKQNANDMTYEQIRVVVDRLRVLLKEARVEDKIMKSNAAADKAEEEMNREAWAAEIKAYLSDHPSYDPKSDKPVQKTIETKFQKAKNFVSAPEQLIAPKQNIIRQLDLGNTAGKIFTEMDAAMEGSGKHYEKSGFSYVKKVNKWIHNSIEAINKVHGNVDSLERKLIDIPELRGIPTLNNGQMTKGDLLCIAANRGQKYTKKLLFENTGGVEDATWQTILDRELETKDIIYMQSIVNLYKDPVIRAKTRELQANQGREVTFIEGAAFIHRGIKYPGGYIRVRTVHDYSEAEIDRAVEFFEGKSAAYFEEDEGKEWGRQYAAETTDQGYLKARSGTKEPIDFSFEGIFTGLYEIAHDHAYREPLQDFFKKMRAPGVRQEMNRVVGKAKVDTWISTNLEIASRPASNEVGYFKSSNRLIKKGLTRFGGKFSAGVIWGNYSAVIKQFEALPEMFIALGNRAIPHALHVNYLMLTNPEKIWGMVKIAQKLDPNLVKYIDYVSDETMSVINEITPQKGRKIEKVNSLKDAKKAAGKGEVGKLLTSSYEFIKFAGFFPHQAADIYTKVLQAFTVMKYVMAGDHPNYPKAVVDAMNEQEQFDAIQGVIAQLSSLTQIQNRHDLKAPIQKNLAMNWSTFFWNYPRNILNNSILDARRSWWETKEGMEKLKSGMKKRGGGNAGGGSGGSGGDGPPVGSGASDDFRASRKSFTNAANIAMTLIIWRTLGAWILAKAASKTFHIADEIAHIKWDDKKSVEEGALNVTGEMLAATFMHSFVSVTPILSGIEYAIDTKKKYGMAEFRDPFTQGLSSIATCAPAIGNMLTLSRDPNRMQMRACMEAESFVMVTLPVRGYYRGVKWLDNHRMTGPSGFEAHFTPDQVDKLQKNLKDFGQNPGKAPEDLVAQAKTLHDQLSPDAIKIPDGTSDAIKMVESKGQWNAPNGVFGFSKDEWKSIMHSAPDLGLTESGRIARDTSQQEKAMSFTLHQNATALDRKDLPVNQHTLYGSHVLGVETYEKIFNAPADAKVKSVLGANALKDHSDLAQFKTIGQVKAHLNSTIDKAHEAAKGDTLTSKTTQNED